MIRRADRDPVDRAASPARPSPTSDGGRRTWNVERRGIAIVVVLTVILALLLIGTPFVLSMLEQERTASRFLAEGDAVLTADGARTAAVSYLLRTHDAWEAWDPARGRAPLNWGTPDWDDASEFAFDWRDLTLSDLRPEVPRRAGVFVQDEQGKVSVNAIEYNPDLLGALQAMCLRTGLDWRDAATAFSVRFFSWAKPQRLRAIVTLPPQSNVTIT